MAMVWRRVGLLEVDYTIFVISEGGRIWPMRTTARTTSWQQYPWRTGSSFTTTCPPSSAPLPHRAVELTIELHDNASEAQLDPWQEVADSLPF